MSKYDRELRILEREFEEKRKKLKKKSAESKAHIIPEKERELADLLHERLCHHNHTDGCGWFYDDGSWTESSRKEYLDKAKKLLKFTDIEYVRSFLEAIK